MSRPEGRMVVQSVVGKTGICRRCGSSLVGVRGLGYGPTKVPGPHVLKDLEHPYGRWSQGPTEMNPEPAFDVRYEYQADHWETAEPVLVTYDGGLEPEVSTIICPSVHGRHLSKEWCEQQKQSGQTCLKPTDRDNWLDDVFACGVHTKVEAIEVQRERQRRIASEEKKARDEIREWQLRECQRAAEWLELHGWGNLLLRNQTVQKQYDSRAQKFYYEMLELKAYLEERGFHGPGNSEATGQADTGVNADTGSVFD